MREWLITYGSWGLAPFGLLGMIVVGQKKTWGWVLSMSTQALWAFYAVGTGQYGFLIGTLSYFAVYLNNWVLWTTGRSLWDRLRQTPPPCSSRSQLGHPCAYRLGHETRHGDPAVGASGINWDDEPDTVTGLLRDLDRLEQEAARDGNAEQPWWYMRDDFVRVLGITFETIPDEDEDEDEDENEDEDEDGRTDADLASDVTLWTRKRREPCPRCPHPLALHDREGCTVTVPQTEDPDFGPTQTCPCCERRIS